MRSHRGFTLIELVTVIVVLAIVAAIGSAFVVTAVDSYRDTQQRAKLTQKGRIAIEQMSRQLRAAVPHSLRVSPGGNCIEFLPIVGAANYLNPVPDTANNAPATVSIEATAVRQHAAGPSYVVIGGLSASEIYSASNPSAKADFSSVSGPPTSVNLGTPHRFLRNSINRRLFLADEPVQFCVSGNNLMQYDSYGLQLAEPSDSGPGGGDAVLVVSDVTVPGGANAFDLSLGSEDRNMAVLINLVFQEGEATVQLNHEVLVRNVP